MGIKTDERREYDRKLASKIRYVMYHRGLTTGDVASMTNIPENTLRKNLCGGFCISVYNLHRVCNALGLDANVMMEVDR